MPKYSVFLIISRTLSSDSPSDLSAAQGASTIRRHIGQLTGLKPSWQFEHMQQWWQGMHSFLTWLWLWLICAMYAQRFERGGAVPRQSQMPRNKKQFHNFCYAEIGSSNSISIWNATLECHDVLDCSSLWPLPRLLYLWYSTMHSNVGVSLKQMLRNDLGAMGFSERVRPTMPTHTSWYPNSPAIMLHNQQQ